MAESQEARTDGRAAQRRRTRKAIVDAASGLIEAGGTPTVDEVAAAAEVSRRTVYMHFPTFDQLLLDATLGALTAAEGGPLGEDWGPDDDAAARVGSLASAVLAAAPRTLPLGRRLLRLTVDAPEPVHRGFRRLEWLESALEPLRAELDEGAYERLRAALAVLVGFESMVVMRDVVGASEEAEREAILWAVEALVASAREG